MIARNHVDYHPEREDAQRHADIAFVVDARFAQYPDVGWAVASEYGGAGVRVVGDAFDMGAVF